MQNKLGLGAILIIKQVWRKKHIFFLKTKKKKKLKNLCNDYGMHGNCTLSVLRRTIPSCQVKFKKSWQYLALDNAIEIQLSWII